MLFRSLTEAMGGTLEPDDTPGGGLTMTLSLPGVPRPDGPVPGSQERDAADARAADAAGAGAATAESTA